MKVIKHSLGAGRQSFKGLFNLKFVKEEQRKVAHLDSFQVTQQQAEQGRTSFSSLVFIWSVAQFEVGDI